VDGLTGAASRAGRRTGRAGTRPTTRRRSKRSCHSARRPRRRPKSILAYRGWCDGDLTDPAPLDVAEAAARWRTSVGPYGPIACYCARAAQRLRLGKPLQSRRPSGTSIATCIRANRCSCLTSAGQAGGPRSCCACLSAYELRAAAAQALTNVYLDCCGVLGWSLNHAGRSGAGASSPCWLDLAPFRKILYSSDGYGPAERTISCAVVRNGIHAWAPRLVDTGTGVKRRNR